MNKVRSRYHLAVGIALATLVVYLATLRNGFVLWDDDLYVYENLHIRALDAQFFRWAFTDLTAIYWQPLTWVSHALDYAFWGLNPLGHHLTSILLHAANTGLVFVTVAELVSASRRDLPVRGPFRAADDRAGLIVAGVTAALFGLHPLRVESVAWVSERKDLLCALFFLLSVRSYISFAKDRRAAGEGSTPAYRDRRYLLSLALFALALASKPMAVTLPAVLLIIDWYPFARIGSLKSLLRACAEKLPFLAGSIAVSVLTFHAQEGMRSIASLDTVPLSSRLLVACRALCSYLGKTLLPVDLLPLYAYPRSVSLFAPEYLVSAVMAAGLTAAAVILARRFPLVPALWGFYVITLVPTLGIVQAGSQAMADRFTYLPGIAPFLVIGLLAAAAWEKAGALERRAPVVKRLLAGAAAVAVLVLTALTLRQIPVWRTSISLWNHVIEHQPLQVYFAYTNRGISFEEAGLPERALEDYTTAIRLNPRDARALAYRGELYARRGERTRAIEDLTRAITADPSSGEAYAARGFEYSQADRNAEALDDFTRAIGLGSAGAEVYLNRGVVLDRAGRSDEAEADYGRAIELNPALSAAYRNRGVVRSRRGRTAQALEDYSRALAIDPGFVVAYIDRGLLYVGERNIPLALRDFQAACDRGSEKGCTALRRYR